MLAHISCNFMVFSLFKVHVTYHHPPNQSLLGATNGNQVQTVHLRTGYRRPRGHFKKACPKRALHYRDY